MIFNQTRIGFGALQTTPDPTGLDVMDAVTLHDMRLVGGDLVERKGCVRVAQFGHDMSALDFVPASSESLSQTVNAAAWSLGLYWTVEFLIELDTTAGTQGLVYVGHTTPAMAFDVTSTNIRFRVWDTANTLTTITVGAAAITPQSVQVTRSGSVLTTRLNNGTPVTGAMSATLATRVPVGELRVMNDETGNFGDGTFDYLRSFSYAKSHHNDRLLRLPNPRSRYVLSDYDGNISAATNIVLDRSRFQAHLIANNTPTEIASLCHAPAIGRAVSMAADENGKKSLLVAHGGKYSLCEVA